MPEKPDQLPSLPSASEAELARLAARRRFTRAGLSAPIVLGTLASKPVLGQSGPPYNCTISGQVSGNVSSAGNSDCSQLGFTPDHWKQAPTWPSGLTRGVTPNQQCNFTGQNAGTRFSPMFLEAFRYVSTGTGQTQACTVYAYDEPGYSTTTGPSAGVATMLQVLYLPVTSAFNGRRLGRAAVASLLNAYSNTLTYPLSPTQVVNIFNQVRSQGSYQVNSTTNWDRERVIQYLESLNGKL